MEENISAVSEKLKELAELKTEQVDKVLELTKLKKICSNKSSKTKWRDCILGCDDEYSVYEYEAYENAEIKKAKKQLCSIKKKLSVQKESKPKKKELIEFTFQIGKLPIVLSILFIINLIFSISIYSVGAQDDYGRNIEYGIATFFLIVALLSVCGIALDLIFRKKIIQAVKKYKEVCRKNEEIEQYNKGQLQLDLTEYEKKNEKLKADYEDRAKKILPLINARLKEMSIKVEELGQELEKIAEKINQEKFDFYSIRQYSGKDLLSIAKILDFGRADTFKDAVNLFVVEKADKEHKQKMLEIERERTDAENYEREERLRIAKRQVAENRRHNQEMEYQAKEKAKQEERYQKEQSAYAKKQVQYAKEQTEIAKRQAEINPARCLTCLKANRCTKTWCIGYVYNGK